MTDMDKMMIEKVARAIWESDPAYSAVKFEHVEGDLAERVRSVARAAITAYNPDDRLREALEELRGEITRAFGVINPQRRLGKALAKAESALSPLPQGDG